MSTNIKAHPQPSPAVLFNEFLTRAAKSGSLSVEHRRVMSRQPDNEIFIRKALVAMLRLAPEVLVSTVSTDLSHEQARPGQASLAMMAESYLLSLPGFDVYTGEPMDGQTTLRPAVSPISLFTLLHTYAYRALSAGSGPITGFGAAAAASAAALSGREVDLRPRVRDAADSVFAQSFSDAHAIVLVAAFNGPEAAREVLAEVLRRREAAGDFGTFTLAPLSQDTGASLQILRSELATGLDFSKMSRLELIGHSIWLASEGLGAWLGKHGASERVAAGVAFAAETASQVVSFGTSLRTRSVSKSI